MFRRKSGILITDLYLYGIKYKPILSKIDRKIRGKITNFFEMIFFGLGRTRPSEHWRTLHYLHEKWRVN
jgi:hypothetical protein